MLKRTGLFVFVTLIFICNRTKAQQQDSFVGTWEQNTAKSKYDPPNRTFQKLTLAFEASGENAWTVTQTGVNGEGKPNHSVFTATLDGNDYPMKGSNDWDSVSVKKLNPKTVILVNKQHGTPVRMILVTVSDDGKSFTEDIIGYDPHLIGFHNIVVFDKQ
jgi:hypothetical protein